MAMKSSRWFPRSDLLRGRPASLLCGFIMRLCYAGLCLWLLAVIPAPDLILCGTECPEPAAIMQQRGLLPIASRRNAVNCYWFDDVRIKLSRRDDSEIKSAPLTAGTIDWMAQDTDGEKSWPVFSSLA